MIDKVPKTVGKRPQPKGGSRKGKPNKATALIKEMIEGALQDVGGQAYLARQAEENPSAFMGLLGKILPKDINVGGQDGNPLIIKEIILTCPEFESKNTNT
jgi:hypothetical protein